MSATPIATPRLVALASGGTGGHMFPASALADALTRRGFEVALITDRRGQSFTVPPCASTIRRTTASPRPVPFTFVVTKGR